MIKGNPESKVNLTSRLETGRSALSNTKPEIDSVVFVIEE